MTIWYFLRPYVLRGLFSGCPEILINSFFCQPEKRPPRLVLTLPLMGFFVGIFFPPV
jgi:hypothetical protein